MAASCARPAGLTLPLLVLDCFLCPCLAGVLGHWPGAALAGAGAVAAACAPGAAPVAGVPVCRGAGLTLPLLVMVCPLPGC